ncbi:MAG: hypothetical protein ACMUIE_06970 [Thermoplasmatota archaeon]
MKLPEPEDEEEEKRAPPKKKKAKKKIKKAKSDDAFDFQRPEDLGIVEEQSYDDMFMSRGTSGKKGESCPVCGTGMTYKERVDSWYCPKCKNFF